MDTQLLIENLMQFSLTRQEAIIYQLLLTEGKLTGYEVSKNTGISRSNAYSSLASLVEKGAAYILEESAKKYIAVELAEFCDNCIQNLEVKKQWIIDHIPKEKSEVEGYITIDGEFHILNKIKNLINETKERVYVTCSLDHMKSIDTELKKLVQQHKKVVVITDSIYHLEGAIIYTTKSKGCQIGIIVDSSCALTGEYGEDSRNTCLYSGERNFVELFKGALANEIKLIEYMKGESEHE